MAAAEVVRSWSSVGRRAAAVAGGPRSCPGAAEPDAASDDDHMDSFPGKSQSQPYCGGFCEDAGEEEFEKIALFMKKAPSETAPKENPGVLASWQLCLLPRDLQKNRPRQ